MIARKEINAHDLNVDTKIVRAFDKASVASKHNNKIGSQLGQRLDDDLVDDPSITQSHIEMSYTESLHGKPEKQRIFSDVLQDPKDGVMYSDEDEDDDTQNDIENTVTDDEEETDKFDTNVKRTEHAATHESKHSLKGDLALLKQPRGGFKRKLSL